MKRDIGVLRQNIRRLISDLPAFAHNRGDALQTQSFDLVRARSIANGIFVDGEPGHYVEYSKGKTPAQPANPNRLQTWHDVRVSQGKTNQYVNLAYTLRMWNSFTVVDSRFAGGHYISTMGTTDAVVLTYINKLVKHYGKFVEPTLLEKEKVLSAFYQDYKILIGTYLL